MSDPGEADSDRRGSEWKAADRSEPGVPSEVELEAARQAALKQAYDEREGLRPGVLEAHPEGLGDFKPGEPAEHTRYRELGDEIRRLRAEDPARRKREPEPSRSPAWRTVRESWRKKQDEAAARAKLGEVLSEGTAEPVVPGESARDADSPGGWRARWGRKKTSDEDSAAAETVVAASEESADEKFGDDAFGYDSKPDSEPELPPVDPDAKWRAVVPMNAANPDDEPIVAQPVSPPPDHDGGPGGPEGPGGGPGGPGGPGGHDNGPGPGGNKGGGDTGGGGHGGGEHGPHGLELPPGLQYRVDEITEMIHLATLGKEGLSGDGAAVSDLPPEDIEELMATLAKLKITSGEPLAVVDQEGRLKPPAYDRIMGSLEHIDKSMGLRLPRIVPDMLKIGGDELWGGGGLKAQSGPKMQLAFYPVKGDAHGHAHPDMALMVVEHKPESEKGHGWLDDKAPYEPVHIVLLYTDEAKYPKGHPLEGKPMTDVHGKTFHWPAFEENGFPSPALREKVRKRDPKNMKKQPHRPIRKDPPLVPEGVVAEPTHFEGEWTVDGQGNRVFTPLAQGSFTGSSEGAERTMVSTPDEEAELMALTDKTAAQVDAEANPHFFPKAPKPAPPAPVRAPQLPRIKERPRRTAEALPEPATPEREPRPMLEVVSAADSEKSLVAAENTPLNNVYVDDPEEGLGLVFGGRGAMGHGAVQEASLEFSNGLEGPLSPDAAEARVRQLAQTAEERIRREASEPGEIGSTTMAGVKLLDDGHQAVVMSVGSDRVYLMRGEDLRGVTLDHQPLTSSDSSETPRQVQDRLSEIGEWGELLSYRDQNAEADRLFGDRHRHFSGGELGVSSRSEDVPIHVELVDVEAGDRFVVVSAGVQQNLMDSEIRAIMRRATSPAEASALLVQAAEERSADGGNLRARPADMTALVMELHEPGEASRPKQRVVAGVEAPRLPESGRREYSVRHDWQPGDAHTGFSQLMHQIEDTGESFGVPPSGQLTGPQVRRLAAEARTLSELEAVEHEVFERAQQERLDTAHGQQRAETLADLGLSRNAKLIEERRQELLDLQRQARRAEQASEAGSEADASAPEVRRRTELDELAEALREIQERYSDDPEARSDALGEIGDRILALNSDPAYRTGGMYEDRRSEQIELIEDYNKELAECNRQRGLQQEVEQAVLGLVGRLRKMIDDYSDDPNAMSMHLTYFDRDAEATRDELAGRLGVLEHAPTRRMRRVAQGYDFLRRKAGEIAAQATAQPELEETDNEVEG